MVDFSPLTDDERDKGATVARQQKIEAEPVWTPAGPDAPPLPDRLRKASASWVYRDADRRVLFYAARSDKPDVGKSFAPLSLWRVGAELTWLSKAVPTPRPIYNLDELAARPYAPVVVCEGEKAADAAAQLLPDCVATTSPNGSESAAQADWAALAGRKVMIWGDADNPGFGYLQEVADILIGLGCDVSTIDARFLAALAPCSEEINWRELLELAIESDNPHAKLAWRKYTKGWDAADAVREWRGAEDRLRAAIAYASVETENLPSTRPEVEAASIRKNFPWLGFLRVLGEVDPETLTLIKPGTPSAALPAASPSKTEVYFGETPPTEFCDDALALSFADRHADELRYIAKWNKWLQFDGQRWIEDEKMQAFNRARAVCREAAHQCSDPRIKAKIASAATFAAVERVARSDVRLAATADQWDIDIWALNTPAGVVALRSGRLRPHRADDYMRKMTAVAPAALEDCPIFKRFIERITGCDVDLIAYLKRVFGYALTGDTSEHALFFAYGRGANGKSVLLSTMAGILGDYHATAPIETFTASSGERHPTDLAGLQGARLVTASETDEGRRWDEAKVKRLTGGDKISARFMRGDFFEFTPNFKLFIVGNNKPGLRKVDEAWSRRINLIPFEVTIPPAERDPELIEKLKAEWPGILRWMINGCVEWQAKRLQKPEAVTKATGEYLAEEDAVAAFIGERCERDPKVWTGMSALFAAWSEYATATGEQIGTAKMLRSRLEGQPGIQKNKRNTGQGFLGVKLKREGLA